MLYITAVKSEALVFRTVCRILTGQLERKRPLGRTVREWNYK